MKGGRISIGGSSGLNTTNTGSTGGAGTALTTAGLTYMATSGGGAIAPEAAKCTDNTFGCKLSHVVTNTKMLFQLLIMFIIVAFVIYYIWVFISSRKTTRSRK